MIAQNIEELIGNTPLVKINSLSEETGTTILGKCEFMNPTSSVKDRIACNMINKAIERGEITKHTTIIEPTSGNTGIGLAAICAAKDLRLILTMPDSMSIERRKLLSHLGAELVLTPAAKGMGGAIEKAHTLAQEIDNALLLQQFNNADNPAMHRTTTAIEILKDTKEHIDIFIAAVGTGGTITGTAEVLREKIASVHIVAVEPAASAVLGGEPAGPHKIQGIGAGFTPDILNTQIYNEVVAVCDNEAFSMAARIAKKEGLLIGISSGANLEAAYRLAQRPENRGKVIVTILCDTAERYLSTELFDH
ncbi:MAG: cysteine synthase A [Sulfurovum sp.]|nr:cysteine synthase A [Sulfurovum sp.]MCB4746257.1 cysteine synthase A [Sulfurovum sp.]MCB4747055.1 cysteine synthase A [Sulfurovum sp.]MCB4751148.1 cysteine synthase A [Sulfurovum sp.]MCB4759053.1 cysteine synthase A [Sulfurovum sp.]